MLIDTHSHIVPDFFPANNTNPYWPIMDHLENDRANVMINGNNFRTITSQSWSPDRRIEDMEREGVKQQVLSPMPELLSYWFNPSDGIAISNYVNEFIAKIVSDNPSKFLGLGMVPLQEPDLASKELEKLKQMGLSGIEVGSNINGVSIGDPKFHSFFDTVEKLNLSVFIHALHPTFEDRIISEKDSFSASVNAVGFPIDVGLAGASLITSGLLEKHKNLRIQMSHGGGTLPSMITRMDHAWSRLWNGSNTRSSNAPTTFLPELESSPLHYAKMLYYDTLVFHHTTIKFMIDLLGIEHLTIGTDYPFLQRESPVGKTLNSIDLAASILDKINYQNALNWINMNNW